MSEGVQSPPGTLYGVPALLPHYGCVAPPPFPVRSTAAAAAATAGPESAVVAVQNKQATLDLFQPALRKLEWGLFDPQTLPRGFDAERYAEQLKRLGT